MTFPEEDIAELKRYCATLSALTESGRTLLLLEGLRLPAGCTPRVCDALLCPFQQDGYPSRLYFSAQVVSPFPKSWNVTNARIGERNWFAFSWRVDVANPTLPQMLRAHLEGLTSRK